MVPSGGITKRLRVELPTRVVTTTMSVPDPRDPDQALFNAVVTIEVDRLPPYVSLAGVSLDYTDRRPPATQPVEGDAR